MHLGGTVPEACGRLLAAWALESPSSSLRCWLEAGNRHLALHGQLPRSLARLRLALARSDLALRAVNLDLAGSRCWAQRAQMSQSMLRIQLPMGGAARLLHQAVLRCSAVLPALPPHLADAAISVVLLAQQHWVP